MDQTPDITAVEDVLRQAMSWAKAQGIPIGPGAFGFFVALDGYVEYDDGSTVCPVGALVLQRLGTRQRRVLGFTSALEIGTGLPYQDLEAFWKGYEQVSYLDRWNRAYYDIGQQFRREWEQGLFDAASETICDGGDPDGV